MAAARASQRHGNRYQKEVERYTPTWLLERVAAFLGPDYFDPCPASDGAAPQVNGLEIPWQGRVWVNPPYRPIAPWITKALTEPVSELLLLVPAYTETKWFRPLFAHPMCFIHGRLCFRRPGDQRPMEYLPHAPHPTVLVYRGPRLQDFADAFETAGPIVQTYRPQRVNGLWSLNEGSASDDE